MATSHKKTGFLSNDNSVVMGKTLRVRCEASWSLSRAWSDQLRDYDLWLVCEGQGRMTLRDGKAIVLRPGICLWMRPGGVYEATHSPVHRLLVTACHFDLLDARGRRLDPDDVPVHEVYDVSSMNYVEPVMRRIVALTNPTGPSDPTIAALLMRGLLTDIHHHASPWPATIPFHKHRHGTSQNILHHKTIDALVQNICERPGDQWTVASMAKSCHLGPDHFRLVFRRYMGMGPQEYIVAQRINRAQQLLEESNLPIKQVAAALGYSDVYFFSRQFHQKAGCTPSNWRRRSLAAGDT
ncbi:MAG: helix-turn-helix transcriptional regulator [Phycisphaerales bacterium]|nr:helix-turn-helix transcriptional regulator [Phycisphaerales bacterium]